ncbi:hypothetical protein H8356DRAFT_1425464 [Neocallimastix lanati (nom. inval.)]|nr:hypothetical protein H8356DRAFT_1425464 [Neocallimastix sp. JGI-2020a]
MENKLEQVGFADPSKPVYCEYCLKGITGKYYIFKQHFYHPEHYLCPGCKNPLEEGLKFFDEKGQPYCNECFSNLKGLKCGYCHELITEGKYIVAFQQKWHIHHVFCATCQKSLGEGKRVEFHGKFYCPEDSKLITNNIYARCQQPIPKGIRIDMMNALCVIFVVKIWKHIFLHCAQCQKSFVQKFGPPARRVQFQDKFYHVNHAICSVCNNSLSKLIPPGTTVSDLSTLFKLSDNQAIIRKSCMA